ncbi:MAG: ABC transporter ATP-binding protein [Chloroflexota bacterium]
MSNILELQQLYKQFGGLTVTDHCDFTVAEGEIHALIGPNGAGKTTLINQVSGLLNPDGGRILFKGRDLTGLPMYRRVHMGLARTYQITNIFRDYSVLDNLALSVQGQSGSSFRFWKPVSSEKKLFHEAAAIAARIGLGTRMDIIAGELSHGEQRQLEVGLALACDAKLLLLDEPMAGMGMDESVKIIDLIRDVSEDVTVLLVEHDMDAVFQLADRISVLVYGDIIATGTPDEIRANVDVQQAYLGEEVPL